MYENTYVKIGQNLWNEITWTFFDTQRGICYNLLTKLQIIPSATATDYLNAFSAKLPVWLFSCSICSLLVLAHIKVGFRKVRQALCTPHLSTAVAWREKKFKHFVFNKYFSLVLGLLKSRISEKINQLLLNKLDFKLFHYKTRVQPVSKITTIATRNNGKIGFSQKGLVNFFWNSGFK